MDISSTETSLSVVPPMWTGEVDVTVTAVSFISVAEHFRQHR